MITNKYVQLIRALQSNDVVSTKELAKILRCSDRSIRNYVQEINVYKAVICSSAKGYTLQHQDVDDILIHFSNTDVKDKELYIIDSLLLSANGISRYDLQEQLYVSDQTIDTYIKNINKQLKERNLKISRRKGFLYLQGKEEDKRKLMKDNLRINSYDMIEKELSSLCAEKRIDYILLRKTLIEGLAQYHIHVNDYSLLNILTHLTVKIIRINANKQISQSKPLLDMEKYARQFQCSEHICKELKKRLAISFTEEEMAAFTALLISKSDTGQLPIDASDQLNTFILNTIKKINEHYDIDLHDNEFISFFLLHLKNLLKRIELKSFNANPLFEQVINFNSLVYDIAVFVASELEKEYHIRLPEEEIAFLAFHIGSIVVKKNILDEDIYIAIERFDFYRYADVLKNKLQETLSENVHIEFIDKETTIPDAFSYDLTISTNIHRIAGLPTKQTITVSPFLSEQELAKIKSEIDSIKKRKKQYRIQTYFEQFFHYDMFRKNLYLHSAEAYICFMSDQLYEDHLVTDTFVNSVLERESITPTSFYNGVAIPHALRCSAKKNCAYVIINDKAIPWGNYAVNMIILIGINEKDQHEFKFLYDNLLNKLNEPDFLKKAIQCKEYKDFLELISSI